MEHLTVYFMKHHTSDNRLQFSSIIDLHYTTGSHADQTQQPLCITTCLGILELQDPDARVIESGKSGKVREHRRGKDGMYRLADRTGLTGKGRPDGTSGRVEVGD